MLGGHVFFLVRLENEFWSRSSSWKEADYICAGCRAYFEIIHNLKTRPIWYIREETLLPQWNRTRATTHHLSSSPTFLVNPSPPHGQRLTFLLITLIKSYSCEETLKWQNRRVYIPTSALPMSPIRQQQSRSRSGLKYWSSPCQCIGPDALSLWCTHTHYDCPKRVKISFVVWSSSFGDKRKDTIELNLNDLWITPHVLTPMRFFRAQIARVWKRKAPTESGRFI